MSRVLLTGAAGFLGAHVLRHYLRETDWHFVVPVTFRHKGSGQRIEWAVGDWERYGGRVTVVRADLAGPVDPVTAALFGEVDVILNFASDTHPPRSVSHPVEFVNNNVGIALHLLEYARTLPGLQVFVQISTDSVYGPALAGTHEEWDPIIPNNPYSASKACQEALAISYWRSFGVPTVIAATMNPTGETQDVEKFVPMTIGKLLDAEPVTIHADWQGNFGSRTYIYGREMAAGLLHILRTQPPVMYGPGYDRPSRWNIVGAEELDNLTVAAILAKALEVVHWRYGVETVDRPEHGHRYSMSGEKLAAAGWKPDSDIRDDLGRMARWTRTNPEWLAR